MTKLMEKNWKILILLDACRYDYFEKIYRKYFKKGNLKKLKSSTTYTLEWLYKTFPKKYRDVVYISGNPVINSKMTMYYKKNPINSKDKFFKIIDTWDWGWDEDFGTVLPDKVNSDFFKYYKKYPNKRFILHYIQPHTPFVPLLKKDNYINKKFKKEKVLCMFNNTLLRKIKEFLRPKIPLSIYSLGSKIKSKLSSVDELHNYDLLTQRYDRDELKEFYMENLNFVLENVVEVVNEVDEEIVITSDHGELLGEHGKFGHEREYENYKELELIPYFEIN